MIIRRVLGNLTAMVAVAALANVASATVLAPGSPYVAPDPFTGPASTDTLVASITQKSFTGLDSGTPPNVRFTGWVTQAVYQEAGTGYLDFYFQVHNDSTSADPIGHLSFTNYQQNYVGSFVDAGVDLGTATYPGFSDFVAGTSSPTLVDRSGGTGAVIDFASFLTGGNAGITQGSTTNVIALKTHAVLFDKGSLQVTNGGVATVQVFGPVPEASTVVGFGSMLGLGGLGMLRLLRRRSTTCA